MTVPMLIQIDKLVQLIESPVFTCTLCSLYGSSLTIADTHEDCSASLATPRAGTIPILAQGDVRSPHAATAIKRLRHAPQSLERCELSRLLAHGPAVRLPPHPARIQDGNPDFSSNGRSNLTAPSAVRGSSYGGTSGSVGSGSSLAGRVSRPEGATPDPPSIRWHELLVHFRQVQKRRANTVSATASGRSAGMADNGRASSRTRDGTLSVDGVSPPTSSGFAHGGSRNSRRRPTGTELSQATLSSLSAGRQPPAGDGASMASSSVTGGSGGRSGGRGGPPSQSGTHSALSSAAVPKGRTSAVPTGKDGGRTGATFGTSRRT